MRQVLGLLVVVWFVLCHPSGGQSSCPNRIRKPWGVMTQAERNLYVEALGIGMQKGYHILFTEVASEKTSSTEFLRTCGFLYWNRRFVLAYENMLRSLGPKYACLTIPYWDYFADYARFVAKKCENNGTSIEACSPILRGLGGSQGTTRSVTINGRTFAGNCVTKHQPTRFAKAPQSQRLVNVRAAFHEEIGQRRLSLPALDTLDWVWRWAKQVDFEM